jgi:hypothetical protein
VSAFEDFLAEPVAPRCWLLEIDAFPLAPVSDGSDAAAGYAHHGYGEVAYAEDDEEGEGESSVLYYSSHGYISTLLETIAYVTLDGEQVPRALNVDFKRDWDEAIAFLNEEGTVARAGATATYFDSAGVLQVAAANTPRRDYDPVTLEAKGLLVEVSRTNSLRNNTMAGAVAGTPGTAPTNWTLQTASGLTREIVGVGTEDGISYVDIRQFGTASSGVAVVFALFESTTQIVAAVGQAWSGSTYVRLAGGTLNGVAFNDRLSGRSAAGAQLENSSASFVPTTAALRTTRLTKSRTLTDASSERVTYGIDMTPTNGAAIDVTLRIGMPQLELGAFLTSVIPTSSAAVTRNTDNIFADPLGPWFNPVEGTLLAAFSLNAIPSTGTLAPAAYFTDGTSNEAMQLRVLTSAIADAVIFDGGGVVFDSSGAAVTAGPVITSALAYKANDCAASINGGAAQVDTSVTLPTVTRLHFGSFGNAINGHLCRVEYYARRLTDAQLQALTDSTPDEVEFRQIATGDADSRQWYDGRVMADEISIDRRIYGRDGVGGLARTLASCSLVNADGGLDELASSYGMDARPARLLLGSPAAPRADFGLGFSGVVQKVTTDSSRVKLELSDGAARLDAPVNTTTYAGTGSLEGGADLAGKPRPLTWGAVFNVSPPLVDSANLIYQVHAGEIQDVPAVYDRQIVLTQGADYTDQAQMLSVAPSAGQYRVWKAGGYFRLGAAPAGTITADVEGDATGGYVDTTADILERVLLIAGVDSSLLDSASFAALAVDAPATVGYHVGLESTPVATVAEALLEGVSAFGGFSRSNAFTVGVIKAPAGLAAAEYGEEAIRYIAREPLPPAVEPIVWRARVAWARNYTVQTDLAAAVPAARITFSAAAERLAVSEDSGVMSRRPLAREIGPTGNLYALEADADTEAARLLALWSADRSLYRIGLPPAALVRDLGEVVTITHPRHGFASGRLARVMGHRISRGGEIELTVLA